MHKHSKWHAFHTHKHTRLVSMVLGSAIVLVAAAIVVPQIRKANNSTLKSSVKVGPQQCAGNTADVCVLAPSISIWPLQNDNQQPNTAKDAEQKYIGGKITSQGGKILQLTSSSGKEFTVIFPVDPLEAFNTSRSQTYEGVKIGENDTIAIAYTEAAGQSAQTILPSQIISASIALKSHTAKSTAKYEKL